MSIRDDMKVTNCSGKLIKNQVVILPFLIMLITMSITGIDASEVLQGRIMQVKDGDTVVVAPLEGGQFFTCRLYGIDAPETAKKGKAGQPYGEDAARELKRLVLGQLVDVETTGSRTYNREVCIISRNGMNVNLEMVKKGYAWAYRQYLKRPYASEYLDAESEARSKRLGLWQDMNPTPPWEFRKRNR